MARTERRLPANAPGPLFVDDACIDCGTCWTLAPATFEAGGDQARVSRQPATKDERARAFMALVSCPVAAIGTDEPGTGPELRTASHAFPDPIADGVFACGYASPDSYGASSYLIAREGKRPVLIDSPRAAAPLLDGIERLGGAEWLLLSHRDDVADHAKLRARLGCKRVLHEADVTRDTAGVELKVTGTDPIALDDDLLVIPVPGHTRGSLAFLWQETFLFSGDHLWGEGEHLGASRTFCWWSWPEQIASMERLLDLRFEWVLPGHGDRFRAASPAAMRAEVERLVKWMRRASQMSSSTPCRSPT